MPFIWHKDGLRLMQYSSMCDRLAVKDVTWANMSKFHPHGNVPKIAQWRLQCNEAAPRHKYRQVGWLLRMTTICPSIVKRELVGQTMWRG